MSKSFKLNVNKVEDKNEFSDVESDEQLDIQESDDENLDSDQGVSYMPGSALLMILKNLGVKPATLDAVKEELPKRISKVSSGLQVLLCASGVSCIKEGDVGEWTYDERNVTKLYSRPHFLPDYIETKSIFKYLRTEFAAYSSCVNFSTNTITCGDFEINYNGPRESSVQCSSRSVALSVPNIDDEPLDMVFAMLLNQPKEFEKYYDSFNKVSFKLSGLGRPALIYYADAMKKVEQNLTRNIARLAKSIPETALERGLTRHSRNINYEQVVSDLTSERNSGTGYVTFRNKIHSKVQKAAELLVDLHTQSFPEMEQKNGDVKYISLSAVIGDCWQATTNFRSTQHSARSKVPDASKFTPSNLGHPLSVMMKNKAMIDFMDVLRTDLGIGDDVHFYGIGDANSSVAGYLLTNTTPHYKMFDIRGDEELGIEEGDILSFTDSNPLISDALPSEKQAIVYCKAEVSSTKSDLLRSFLSIVQWFTYSESPLWIGKVLCAYDEGAWAYLMENFKDAENSVALYYNRRYNRMSNMEVMIAFIRIKSSFKLSHLRILFSSISFEAFLGGEYRRLKEFGGEFDVPVMPWHESWCALHGTKALPQHLIVEPETLTEQADAFKKKFTLHSEISEVNEFKRKKNIESQIEKVSKAMETEREEVETDVLVLKKSLPPPSTDKKKAVRKEKVDQLTQFAPPDNDRYDDEAGPSGYGNQNDKQPFVVPTTKEMNTDAGRNNSSGRGRGRARSQSLSSNDSDKSIGQGRGRGRRFI